MYVSVCLVCWTPLQSALIDLPPWTLDAAWPLQQPASNWSCSTAVDSLGTPTLHVSVCVCVSSTSCFGWAPSSTPHLANLSIAFRMYPKAIVMGRVLSPYLHASIFTLLSQAPRSSLIYFFLLYSPRHLSDAWWKPSPLLGQVSFRRRRELAPAIK